ncbi:MAG: serine/threonine-protein kinase, partial [Nitrospira sp.]|nr:serine/threonine-protein kinase [Nitrospira sp.]
LIDLDDRPRITDFGLAKRLDEVGELTLTGEMLGTPAYLSPEQASGRHKEVDGRSDVYAVGAILYESVTGRPPFLAANMAQTLASIRDGYPVTPRRLNPEVPPDLEAIALKCLEKDPRRRYATAADLADDLGRFLRGEPTRARRVGALGRIHRWVRRRPMQALTLTLAVITALATSVSSVRLARAERETARANALLAGNLRRVNWQRAEEALTAGRATEALVSFSRLLRDQPDDRILATRLVALLSQRSFAHPVGQLKEHGGPVNWVEFDTDGRRLATASADGEARVWDAGSGELGIALRGNGPLHRASFCGDGERLLTLDSGGRVALWDLVQQRRLRSWAPSTVTTTILALSQDGSRFAVAVGGRSLEVVEAMGGTAVGDPVVSSSRIGALAMDAKGTRVSVGDDQGRIWVTTAGEWRPELGPHAMVDGAVSAMTFNPGEHQLLVGTRGGSVELLDLGDLARTRLRARASGEVTLLRWNPDGARALVGRFGEWPELWDMPTGRLLGKFQAMASDVVMDARWSPDGESLLVAYRSGIAVAYDPSTRAMIHEPFEHRGPITHVAFGGAGGWLATSSHDGTARVWRLRARGDPPKSAETAGRVGSELHWLDGRAAVTVFKDNAAWVCDAGTGEVLGAPVRHPTGIQIATLSPDGRILATAEGGVLRL